jgi:mRNA interferase MazF
MKYPAKPRTLLLCDYGKGGFQPPEMVKRRPAIVLVGSLPGRTNLHTVVPLSGTPSAPGCQYQCKITLDSPLPEPFDEIDWWVKADMLATVGLDRLDLFQSKRDQYGKRKYFSNLRVSEETFELVKDTVRQALGL